MDDFEKYLDTLQDPDHRERMGEILDRIHASFPDLGRRIAWNQPMFTDHGTFIIGLSAAKGHLSIAPEIRAMEHFADAIDAAGYSRTKGLFRIRWEDEVDYSLIADIVRFNREDKKNCTTFWRK